MSVTLLTSDSKEALCKTIRALRPRLLDQLLYAATGEYRLNLTAEKAKLPEARRCRRERLDAWLDAQVRGVEQGKEATDTAPLRQRFLTQAIKEAAHTWVNRLVLLRILEQHGLVSPAVLTGGWKSQAYAQEFIHYAGPLATDDTRGYRDLLDTVFFELSLELPGLYGPVGLVALFPMPAALLRDVVDALNEPALDSAWGDDMTLGWVYQYWNDPEREQLEVKISDGGKIEPYEIASKTQMFTERYMVEWLLENSLGLTWLRLCKKNQWVPRAESVIATLEERRASFRSKRETGEVPLNALMPTEGELENAWKYYVPQTISEDTAVSAPASIGDVKLLDPACGSGHFLVSAFSMFVAMYTEEAKHRGEDWSNDFIAESILANNLHGIDIDPRAIQIAAAALWLKAKLTAPNAKLGRMNLVAPCFRLDALPKDDPTVNNLYAELDALGVPAETTSKLVGSLSGVDHLGTLLRVDHAIAAIASDKGKTAGEQLVNASVQKKIAIESAIAQFLNAHGTDADLGLRLEGEQLATGLRFINLVKEGTYDVVVGNPPYLGTQRLADSAYIDENYKSTKEDLYGTFIDRSLQLLRPSGLASLITIRTWMFVSHFRLLRELILDNHEISVLADLGVGGFDAVPGVEAAMIVIRNRKQHSVLSTALRAISDKKSELMCQSERYEFDGALIRQIEGCPIVYQWDRNYIRHYLALPKLGADAPARVGMKTSNNARFVRRPWEVSPRNVDAVRTEEPRLPRSTWVPYIKGAGGKAWVEPLSDVVQWAHHGLQVRLALICAYHQVPQCERLYFTPGVAFTTIARRFLARAHRYRSIFDVAGSSVFHGDIAEVVCLLNSERARRFVETVNPTINFQVGDVNRLPLFPVANSDEIFATVDRAFTEHESHREPSVEFKSVGASPFRHAQQWAQTAIDRADSTPLSPYVAEYDEPAPEAHVSFAVGVALGRFSSSGDGILAVASDAALPAGILFVGPSDGIPDSLVHPACAQLVTTWGQQQSSISNGKVTSLRDWLRKDFFAYHKGLYDNRPIYFPLSSARRSFVALVSIHRWVDNTLQTLLVDHLKPALRQLEGEITDYHLSRSSSDKKVAAAAEKQYATTKRLEEELSDFIAAVSECAERGVPPTDPKCRKRTADATFHLELDDGVMINSAALWPLLDAQWKDPKKWWKELCTAEGRKDYDWAQLAARYFPKRVDGKCQADPSLAIAQGCFWKYHPAQAYAWELRLQDELRSDFVIDEEGANVARQAFLEVFAAEAKAITDKEKARRERKAEKGAEADEVIVSDTTNRWD